MNDYRIRLGIAIIGIIIVIYAWLHNSRFLLITTLCLILVVYGLSVFFKSSNKK